MTLAIALAIVLGGSTLILGWQFVTGMLAPRDPLDDLPLEDVLAGEAEIARGEYVVLARPSRPNTTTSGTSTSLIAKLPPLPDPADGYFPKGPRRGR